jgi:hypothetical protein
MRESPCRNENRLQRSIARPALVVGLPSGSSGGGVAAKCGRRRDVKEVLDRCVWGEGGYRGCDNGHRR